jgi:hypothetical protein
MQPALQVLCDDIEPAAAWAAALLRETNWRDHVEIAQRAMRAAHDYATLYRAPRRMEYLPRELIRSAVSGFEASKYSTDLSAVQPCIGDTEQILACLRLLLGCCELASDAQLLVELPEDAEPPHIRLRLDGPGQFRSAHFAGDAVRIDLRAVFEAWTRATQGGRIDPKPDGFELRLAGVKVPSSPIEGADEIASAFERAEHELRLLAVEAGERPAGASLQVAQSALRQCLDLLDAGAGSESPADFAALFRESFGWDADASGTPAIVTHAHISPRIPAITIRRIPIIRFWKNVSRMARGALPRGGTVSVVADYSSAQRCVEILVSVSGGSMGEPMPALAASQRRAVVEAHEGQLVITRSGDEVLINAELPDKTGRALATRIPNFDRLSPRSVQLLRLVTGGESGLPERSILASVLEDELERWLVPRLSVAPATTLAHEVGLRPDRPAGFSEQRFTKAMAQIRRGRPKKEICRPPHAGEVLWSFASTDRHRRAIGAEAVSEGELKELAARLLLPEPPAWECLRMISKVLPAEE